MKGYKGYKVRTDNSHFTSSILRGDNPVKSFGEQRMKRGERGVTRPSEIRRDMLPGFFLVFFCWGGGTFLLVTFQWRAFGTACLFYVRLDSCMIKKKIRSKIRVRVPE